MKALVRLRTFTGWSAPSLFAFDKSRFSRNEIHIVEQRKLLQIKLWHAMRAKCRLSIVKAEALLCNMSI